MKRALILVDLQADFTEWKKGSLAVPGTDELYVRSIEATLKERVPEGTLILATQDWHPPDHISFYTNHPGRRPFETIEISGRTQILWPPHCIQGTEGARILVDNNIFWGVIQKGKHPLFDSYSAFKDEGGNKTELEGILSYHGIDSLTIFGLALDYCVKATAMDAKDLGFDVTVIKGLSMGVDPKTTEAALVEMKMAGIDIMEDYRS